MHDMNEKVGTEPEVLEERKNNQMNRKNSVSQISYIVKKQEKRISVLEDRWFEIF